MLSHSFFLFLFLSLLVDLGKVNRDQAIESFISGFGENKWCSRRFYTKLVFEFSRNFLEIFSKFLWKASDGIEICNQGA